MSKASTSSKQQCNNNCSCEDKTETLKITDNFVCDKFSLPTEKTIDLLNVSLFQSIETTTFFATYSSANLSSPPPLNKTDVQSEFGVFLI